VTLIFLLIIKGKHRAPSFDPSTMNASWVVGSVQALPRHTKGLTYCCFLPDLTGFMSFRCAGPERQHHLLKAASQRKNLGKEFSLAVADCEYRAPLPPRLARCYYY